jgi:hypothetical protein
MSSNLCLANLREEIRMFLANLEIYGSMPPDTCSDSKEFFITDYMTQCRLLSLTQVSACIRKLEQASSEDSTPAKKALFSNPLLKPIVNLDIPNVIVILKKIRKILQMKKEASTPSHAFVIGAEDSDEEAKEDQIDLELQSQPS